MNFKFFCVVCTISMGVVNPINTKEITNRVSEGQPPLWVERFTVRIISAINDRTSQGYLSTGAAVTQQHVVTVAQAIAGFGVWRIGYGDILIEQHYEVISRNAIPHPEFNATLLHNNVGVIRVPYLLSNWIYRPINFSSTLNPNLVSGYGFINDDMVLADELQVSRIEPSPLLTCLQVFGDEFVQDDNRCFSNINPLTQIRNGDQGGPAFYSLHVTGIISFFGLSPGSPIVLVDLREHQGFLEAQFAV